MPLYEYRCKECGHHFEKIQSYSAPDAKQCPVCGGAVERLISAPSFRFKGSGWYETDYARKGKAKSESAFDSAPANHAPKDEKPAADGSKPAAVESKPAASSTAPAAAASKATAVSGSS